jgi:hypothetical protein
MPTVEGWRAGILRKEGNMKRFVIALVVALLATVLVAGSALAWGDVDAEVTCNEITASEDAINVGDTIYFYGSVTVVAHAQNHDNYCGCHAGTYADVNAAVKYVIKDPEGNVLDVGYVALPDYYQQSTGFGNSDVFVDETIYWTSNPIFVEMVGDYLAKQKGCVEAVYGHWEQDKIYEDVWIDGHYEHCWCGHCWGWVDGHYEQHWTGEWTDPYFTEDDSAHDRCCSRQTFEALGGQAILNKPHAVLTIVLPDGRALFFGSNGWDDPTDQLISFSDGTWEVEIASGTLIELDGKWHMLTTLTVDDQGQVTFEYGKTGTEATDIGLSQPIAITKVG